MPSIYAILRKHTKGNRTMKRYTLAMKRKLVAEYATGDFPRKEFLSKHQIPNSTFHQWIHAYAEELLPALDAGMTVSSFRRLKNDCNRKQRIIEFLSLVNCTVNSHYRIKVAEIERIMRDQPKMFSIRLMCEALGVKHCTIVNRKKRHTPWFVLHKEQAVEHVKRVFNGSHQCYGAEKIAAVLKREGRKIGIDCVRQVMQEQKLVSIRGIYRHEYLKELRSRDNLVNKEFNPAAPNAIWVSDVTEIWHKDKKFYICVVIDLFARKVVSWRIGQFNNTRLTLGTFLDAFAARGNPKALTFHTDRGSNYTSFCFSRRIQQLHVRRSFSKAHNPYDNSICEAFFNSMKAEELYRRRYRSVREFKNSVATYIDEYNAKRPHATNHYLSPDEKESRWFAAKTDEAVRFCPENREINSETEPPAQNPKV